MGYFPFFIDIKGKKGLVIGGGRIAEHKISKLLAYEPELTVVARKVSDSIKSIEGINIIEREFVNSDHGRMYLFRSVFPYPAAACICKYVIEFHWVYICR